MQSLLNYEDKPRYDAVILDEFRSLLAYFNHQSNSMFEAKDGRKSQIPFMQALTRRCREAKYLIILDADLFMDGAVMTFLEFVRPGCKDVVHIKVQEKNPCILREVDVWYDNARCQTIEPMSKQLLKAIEKVKRDPEERIFVVCGSKKLMSQQNRRNSKDMPTPSYFDFFVQQGIPKEEILIIHGDVVA